MDILEIRKINIEKKNKKIREKHDKYMSKRVKVNARSTLRLEKLIIESIKNGKNKVKVNKYVNKIDDMHEFLRKLENKFDGKVKLTYQIPYYRSFDDYAILIGVEGEY